MSYYDHATAMACKVGRWSEVRAPKSYELEIMAIEQKMAAKVVDDQSLFTRFVAALRSRTSTQATDISHDTSQCRVRS